jgi:hypothetical protein
MKSRVWALSLCALLLASIPAPQAHAAIYAFTSHTFTACSTTGPAGPTAAACRGLYSTTWDENSSYFDVTSGIQYWTVPATGRYYIDAYGAGGGGGYGGGGARIADTFELTEGEIIRILVGQTQNAASTKANAGGGGTFVIRTPFNTNGSILIIAGGGGGAESSASPQSNAPGSISTSGNAGTGTVSASTSGAGGTNGSGGGAATTDNSGGGGGGFFTNGATNTQMDNRGGYAFVNGGGGGPLGTTGNIAGGFGGGGASRNQAAGGGGAGGGGGYSGGGGGDNVVNYAGGGGGSYFANGLNINRVTATAGTNPGSNGYVTITALARPTLTLSIAGSVSQAPKGQSILLTATSDQIGKITYFADGKKIPGCINLTASVGSNTCSWKPSVQRTIKLSATLAQNNDVAAIGSLSVTIVKRTTKR